MRRVGVLCLIFSCWAQACFAEKAGVRIVVSIGEQALTVYEGGKPPKRYAVSTSSKGPGSRLHSGKTPLGDHEIARKIGAGLPEGAVLKNRVFTGRVIRPSQGILPSGEDAVTTRILWLRGLEPGRNLGGRVDTFRRLIYIHGTPDEGLIGAPVSHGCVRMKNRDVVELFERVSVGTPVRIVL